MTFLFSVLDYKVKLVKSENCFMTNDELRKTLSEKEIPNGFIKTTEKPVEGLTAEQKVLLNRKGNALFNQGRYEEALSIYMTTGYSDGLSRVGDIYAEKKQSLKALKLYQLAHNKKSSEPIIQKIAEVLSVLIKEEKSE